MEERSDGSFYQDEIKKKKTLKEKERAGDLYLLCVDVSNEEGGKLSALPLHYCLQLSPVCTQALGIHSPPVSTASISH